LLSWQGRGRKGIELALQAAISLSLVKNSSAGLNALASKRSFPFLLFLVSLAYLLPGCNRDVNFYDEGLTVYGAARVLAGDLPYRDFWTIYPPGQFWLLAVAFRLFATSLIVARIVGAATNAAVTLCVYLLARKILPWRYALFPWFLVLVWFAKLPMYASSLPSALLFGLASCLSLLRGLDGNRKPYLFVAGFLTGIATLFRHDIGLYTFISQSATAISYMYAHCALGELTRTNRLVHSLYTYCIFALGLVGVLLPVAALLAAGADSRCGG